MNEDNQDKPVDAEVKFEKSFQAKGPGADVATSVASGPGTSGLDTPGGAKIEPSSRGSAASLSNGLLIAFFLIAGLVVLVYLANVLISTPRRLISEIGQQITLNDAIFKSALDSIADPEELRQASREHSLNHQKLLRKLSQLADGRPRQAIEMWLDFLERRDNQAEKWRVSATAFYEVLFLDYTALKTAQELQHRKQIAKAYLAETVTSLTGSQQLAADLAHRLVLMGVDDPFVKRTLEETIQVQLDQKSIFEALMNQHFAFGKTYVEFLETLEHCPSWTVKDGQLVIDDPETFQKVYSLLGELNKIKANLFQNLNTREKSK